MKYNVAIYDPSQEPEGPRAPKTLGHWKTMWASDCARLEEAHQRGDDAEVLVYGRKYVVDMKVQLFFVNHSCLSRQYSSTIVLRSSPTSFCTLVASFGGNAGDVGTDRGFFGALIRVLSPGENRWVPEPPPTPIPSLETSHPGVIGRAYHLC